MAFVRSERAPIAPLPPAEVEKICAGEVVERPLSVVKELVENALDSEARHITVELEDGGRRLVRVIDDGHGIPYAELPLALRPHHTSKVTCLSDLYGLTTLGFRGEALSAVSTVSQTTLSSRASGEDFGGRLEVHGGALISHTRSNIQRGTEVEVRELFFNTPARLKFLRHAASETSQISTLLTSYALAYPEVRFELLSGGRMLLSSDGDGNLEVVARGLLGPKLSDSLATVHFEFPPNAISGFISAPHQHWHNRTRQWYFVNRRPVGNKLLYKAVDDAMREFISPGKFPAGVFFLDLPPEEIDVNVHPAKSEINFSQNEAIYSLVTTAVRRALGRAASERQRHLTRGMALIVTPLEKTPAQPEPLPDYAEMFRQRYIPGYPASDYEPQLDPEAPRGHRGIPVYDVDLDNASGSAQQAAAAEAQDGGKPGKAGRARKGQNAEAAAPVFEPQPLHPEEVDLGEIHEQEIREVLQVADTYLVVVTDIEVYLIDQHAAHERILFEQLWRRVVVENGVSQSRQKLMFPIEVALGQAESHAAEGMLPHFARAGFGAVVEDGVLRVDEVPTLLTGKVTAELLQATLDDLLAFGSRAAFDDRLKRLTATLACKAAIKAGQRLPESERLELVRQLISGAASLTCPHGRPTILRLDESELARMFLR